VDYDSFDPSWYTKPACRFTKHQSEEQSMNIADIQSLIKDFESSTLMTLELEMDNFKLKLSKNKTNHIKIEENDEIPVKPQPKETQQVTEIKAPLVGTFYQSDAPGKKPFATVGEAVEKGDVLCIIEAMKIMNEITAPKKGVVKDILVKDGQAVGFDQILMTLEDA
jgi:acetyl-CoA carboxylase biotin carboxyl carrier protein